MSNFNSINYLSATSTSCVRQVEDIAEVVELEAGDIDQLPSSSNIVEGEIVGFRCIMYTGCSTCKVKVDGSDGTFAECNKCKMMLKL